MRDSLAILQQADQVFVMTGDQPHKRFQSAGNLITYLGRHGIRPQQVSDVAEQRVGEVILSYAEDENIDLLIMGAYGRPRWREVIWGGVTHHVLGHAQRPLLMSH